MWYGEVRILAEATHVAAEYDLHAGPHSCATNCGNEVLHAVMVTQDCTSCKRETSGDHETVYEAADEEIGLNRKVRSNVPSDHTSVPPMPLSCTEYFGLELKPLCVTPTSYRRTKRSATGCSALLVANLAPGRRQKPSHVLPTSSSTLDVCPFSPKSTLYITLRVLCLPNVELAMSKTGWTVFAGRG